MFSEVIKELRKSRNISQADLALAMDVVQQTVGKWEKDDSYPNVETLKKLATFFNVTIDYLLEMPQPPTRRVNITSDERDLISGYRALDEWGRSSIRNTLNHELQRCAALPGAKKKRSAM